MRKGCRGYQRVFILGLIPAGLIITWLCKRFPGFSEKVFSQGIYHMLASIYGGITSLLPFSLAEVIVVLLPFLCLFFLLRFLIRLIKGKGSRAQITGYFFLNLSCILSMLFFMYVMLCGVNYHRYSFARHSGLMVCDSSIEELYQLCEDLSEQAKTFRGQLKELGEKEVFRLSTSDYKTAKKARDAMSNLAKQFPILDGFRVTPKKVFLSKFMSYTEITGIYFPFTVEANVNVDVTDLSIPYTMCHELSHVRGFMREDEANFIAYLACVESGDVEFQYSGTMLALIHAGNALYAKSPSLYAKLRETYSEGMITDLRHNSEYWEQFSNTIIASVSNKVNDTYLKANNQQDGVQSYGRMVDLLLAWWRR